jgi:hypothetical protein
VRFVRWGPHLTGQELLALAAEGGVDDLIPADRRQDVVREVGELNIVRVCYHDPNLDPFALDLIIPKPNDGDAHGGKGGKSFPGCDGLFLVRRKIVVPLGPNPEGDEWKKALRKQLAKILPAIDVERP